MQNFIFDKNRFHFSIRCSLVELTDTKATHIMSFEKLLVVVGG